MELRLAKVVDQAYEPDALPPLVLDWLREREDQAGWGHVWGKLIDQGFEPDALLPLGRHWLGAHEKQHGSWLVRRTPIDHEASEAVLMEKFFRI